MSVTPSNYSKSTSLEMIELTCPAGSGGMHGSSAGAKSRHHYIPILNTLHVSPCLHLFCLHPAILAELCIFRIARQRSQLKVFHMKELFEVWPFLKMASS